MDASNRDVRAVARVPRQPRLESTTSPRATAIQAHGLAGPPLAGLRVALVHDWLTGMRGGEKCLEVLCRAFPDATLYTLIHQRGSLSPAIESMAIRTSPLQKIPGVFRHYRHLLPIMPMAARAWRPRDVDLVISLSHCVAKAIVPPPGVPHVCYCFTPMRYAWQGRDTYLESWTDRPVRRFLARKLLDRLRRWDRETSRRVSQFVAISETVRGRIARCYRRDSRVIQPPVDAAFYTADPDGRPRDDAYLVVSALVPYKRIDQAVSACTAVGASADRDRRRARAGPTRGHRWPERPVPGMAARRGHPRPLSAVAGPCCFRARKISGSYPIEALACGAPVIALGRGGAAETVDDAVGRTYPDPTTDALRGALDEWESLGCPHDSILARRRAEAFALPLFRQRLLGFLAEVVASANPHSVPPAPHMDLRS